MKERREEKGRKLNGLTCCVSTLVLYVAVKKRCLVDKPSFEKSERIGITRVSRRASAWREERGNLISTTCVRKTSATVVPVNKTRRLSRYKYVAVKRKRATRRKRNPNRPTIDSLSCKVAHSIQREGKETDIETEDRNRVRGEKREGERKME